MTAVNVVIGGGSGMGLAVAERFAARGPLVVADRDSAAAAEVAKRLGDGVVAVDVDVRDASSVDELATWVESLGPLGALVHTAGLSPSMSAWCDILVVNHVGTARVLDAFLPRADGGSVAVCFASVAAARTRPDESVVAALREPYADDLVDRVRGTVETGDALQDSRVAYSLSKWGVLDLVARAAGPWADRGARVMAVSPGVVDTPMGRLELEQQARIHAMVDQTPLRRTADAAEIADVVEFLVSPSASYMTGSQVVVDGGYLAASAAATDVRHGKR